MDIQQIAEQLGVSEGDVPEFFAALAIESYKKYQKSGSRRDISETVRLGQLSVLTSPEGDVSLPSRLNNLGCFLESQYERTGETADLEQAIAEGATHLRIGTAVLGPRPVVK
jgi:hypothetical protein